MSGKERPEMARKQKTSKDIREVCGLTKLYIGGLEAIIVQEWGN